MANPTNDQRSRERRNFEYLLRTGLVLPSEPEQKFNPYHDPHSGQFTTASGTGGSGTASKLIPSSTPPLRTRKIVPGPKQPTMPRRLLQRRNDGRPVAELTPLHNELRADAVKFPPKPGTQEWSVVDLADWKLAGGDIYTFKRQWVRGYRDAIKAAAQRFDLPVGLVAGVAFTEVGGDPLAIDKVAYNVRDLVGSSARDRTSFGNLSVQFRRAATSLGYDPENELTSRQCEAVLSSLQDPRVNIFVAAKHLSDLRNVDFRTIPSSQLTQRQIEIVASRYNRGMELSRSDIERNLSYGRSITKRWRALNSLVQ